MRAIIFANGEFRSQDHFPELKDGDLIIAANGGSRHCLKLGIIPDILIGDLDSVDRQLLKDWQDAGLKVIEYPEEKDQTDLELALIYAQQENSNEILVFGGIGGRLDMTLANLILLAHPELTIPTTLICDKEKVYVLRPGDTLKILGESGDTVSLIPLHPGETRVTSEGLKYPLKNDLLEFGFTRGISNCLLDNKAQIKLITGLMVVIHVSTK
jgi:thiamine pyrophosphokinase